MSASPSLSLKKAATAQFPTRFGNFLIHGFQADLGNGEEEESVVLVMGDVTSGEPPLLRIHSQCLTGDVFHSLRCDCRAQLELSLESIAAAGRGLVIYEEKEGRGIGLMNKLRAYELQDRGMDTVEANLSLGFAADLRDYRMPAAILRYLGVRSVKLLSNNPEKIAALERAGITVAERISAQVEELATTKAYLETKREKMGHLL